MIDLIKDSFERLIAHTDLRVKRGLYETFSPGRLTGLVGPRGVGKTTLMLQHIKEHLYREGKAFYFLQRKWVKPHFVGYSAMKPSSVVNQKRFSYT